MTIWHWLIIFCGALALLYGVITTRTVMAAPTGTDRMRQIAAAIQEGARAYLNRQYMTIGIADGGDSPGLTVAEVGLRDVWDGISQVRIGASAGKNAFRI